MWQDKLTHTTQPSRRASFLCTHQAATFQSQLLVSGRCLVPQGCAERLRHQRHAGFVHSWKTPKSWTARNHKDIVRPFGWGVGREGGGLWETRDGWWWESTIHLNQPPNDAVCSTVGTSDCSSCSWDASEDASTPFSEIQFRLNWFQIRTWEFSCVVVLSCQTCRHLAVQFPRKSHRNCVVLRRSFFTNLSFMSGLGL